ncbi:MAG: DsbC family protein [Gammaproteobacteria bacterium]|nr:MAG: DsbC family protein [Gammaproteobacteria bacterium]
MKEDINKTILKAVNKISPGVKPDIISPSPIDGIYEVVISSKLVYISADGKYLFDGKLFDITKREDLSAPIEAKVRKKAIDKVVNGGGLITYKPEKTKYVATVFTDIDCGYCRKLHSHIDEYNSLGIEVRYMFMPRAGINSNSYKKAVSAVCADNPQKALTDLKSGKTIPSKNCENHIAEQFELARQIGIRGTPGIVTESGRVLPGYMPPQRLLFELQRDVVEGK